MLRLMSPEQRLTMAFNMTAIERTGWKIDLQMNFPEKSESEIHSLFIDRLNPVRTKAGKE